MTNELRTTGNIAGDHLAKIAELFKAPKITLVVRSPELQDGDMILTDDDLDLAIAAIENLKNRKATLTNV